MKLHNPDAQIFIPDGSPLDNALKRTTHLAVGAHPDDVEILGCHGILECFGRQDKWFTGVVVTNGAGSIRDNIYAHYSDEDICKIRNNEQKKAAYIGEYSAQFLLDYTSTAIKDPNNRDPVEDLIAILKKARPDVVYIHNLADRHATHVATTLKVIHALRELPGDELPRHLYGCEVWGSLDWMVDDDKAVMDTSSHENLQMALIGVFDSQISAGKHLELGIIGRGRMNATFSQSHRADISSALTFAMDLTPLITQPTIDIESYVNHHIERFRASVLDGLRKLQK